MHRSNTILMVLACLLLLTALVGGGNTHAGYLSDVVLELLACPILLLLAYRALAEPDLADAPRNRGALLFTLALLTIPLLQIIPLAPGLAAKPHGSINLANDLSLLSPQTVWRPLSVAPEATWLAWLSLLPPVALFWAVTKLERQSRRVLCALIILVGAISVPLAFLQLIGGPNSEFRFYEFTNRDEAVGFFANRNHFAAFLYCTTLFVGAVALTLLSEYGSLDRKREQSAAVFVMALAFCLIIVLTAVQAMARSRAGVLLQGLALISLIALAPPTLVLGQARSHVRKILIVGLIVTAAVIGQLLLYRFVDRFASENLAADARVKFLANTLEAARAYMPFGSGFGSFIRVYGTFEKPGDTLAGRFANHAHNDWAELWLETGIAGLLLAAIYTGWLLTKGLRLRSPSSDDEAPLDRLLSRAGWVALLLLLIHSLVDYPLRTEAIMAVFALATGLQMEAPKPAQSAHKNRPLATIFKRRHSRRHEEEIAVAPQPSSPQISEAADAPRTVHAIGDRRWEAANPWPEEWKAAAPPAAAAPRPSAQLTWPTSSPPPKPPSNDPEAS